MQLTETHRIEVAMVKRPYAPEPQKQTYQLHVIGDNQVFVQKHQYASFKQAAHMRKKVQEKGSIILKNWANLS